MNSTLLIDAIVHQTMALIVQMATSAGLRAPLAQIGNQVFLDLVRELEAQGIRQKVVADMFGLALRTYQKKVQRLTQSATDRERTLWEAVYEEIGRRKVASRTDILRRFAADDEATVRGILRDMVSSGLLFESGSGLRVAYRVASEEDLDALTGEGDDDENAAFVWAAVYRLGPVTRADLQARVRLDLERLDAILDRLVADGRVQRDGQVAEPEVARYVAARFMIPLDAQVGWAAAVFDHYQAVVQTIVAKLAGDAPDALYPGRAGGSTWSFDIWPGHPHEAEVQGLLADIRARVAEVEKRVFEYNVDAPRPAVHGRVTFYLGQSTRDIESAPKEGSS